MLSSALAEKSRAVALVEALRSELVTLRLAAARAGANAHSSFEEAARAADAEVALEAERAARRIESVTAAVALEAERQGRTRDREKWVEAKTLLRGAIDVLKQESTGLAGALAETEKARDEAIRNCADLRTSIATAAARGEIERAAAAAERRATIRAEHAAQSIHGSSSRSGDGAVVGMIEEGGGASSPLAKLLLMRATGAASGKSSQTSQATATVVATPSLPSSPTLLPSKSLTPLLIVEPIEEEKKEPTLASPATSTATTTATVASVPIEEIARQKAMELRARASLFGVAAAAGAAKKLAAAAHTRRAAPIAPPSLDSSHDLD